MVVSQFSLIKFFVTQKFLIKACPLSSLLLVEMNTLKAAYDVRIKLNIYNR